jgi:OOP family OmpA-OmpF porin
VSELGATHDRVYVQACTDSRGAAERNRELSRQRADSVRQQRLSRGVAPDQIQAQGLGGANPVASNQTAAGREQNRRVEVVFPGVATRLSAATPGIPARTSTP